MKLNEIEKRKTLILGFGREGQNTFLFLRNLFPKKVFCLADEKELIDFSEKEKGLISSELNSKKIKIHFGKDYLNYLEDYDLIIKSPGISFKKISKSILPKITSQTNIFFDNFEGKIIGVTGTKGKSTTSSLIYSVLKDSGMKVYLAGNIGKPVLEFIFKKDSVFVYELSSHQLYSLRKSPSIAVFLNIYPDHLDYYKDFNEYVSSKKNITKYQGKEDYLIYNINDPIVKNIAEESEAKKISIRGKYYDLNIDAAKKVAKIFKIPEENILKSIKAFKPLEHRLEFVGNFENIDFYNDSMSTIPQTTILALDYFKNKIQTLILGGSDKNLDFKELANKIDNSKIKTLIFFPETGEKIWEEIHQKVKFNHFFVNNMEEAVKLCYLHTDKDKICLLSPACASFTNFKDYKERGNLFKKNIKKFFNERKSL